MGIVDPSLVAPLAIMSESAAALRVSCWLAGLRMYSCRAIKPIAAKAAAMLAQPGFKSGPRAGR